MGEPFPPHLEAVADHLYVVFTDWVPSCGCGYPDQAMRLIYDLLYVAAHHEDDREKRYEALCGTAGSLQLVLAVLNKAELMSHATDITLSSLTDRGWWVLWAIEELGGIDNLPACMEISGYPHYEPSMKLEDVPECTEACWTIPVPDTPGGAAR